MGNRIVVIGLGSFGIHVTKELAKHDFTVIAIDKVRESVEQIKNVVSQALIIDSTNEEALSEINWSEIDIAIVAIGDPNLEASIITVTLLKQFGVRRIISRVSSQLHGRILTQVGSNEIVNPEKDMAGMLVNRLAMKNVIDMRFFDEENVISEFIPPASFMGNSLLKLDLRKKLNISIVAIRRYPEDKKDNSRPKLVVNPSATEIVTNRDVLIGIGKKDDFEKIGQY
ncbi:TrkA family potassium uptake protein [bacterium]|nr:TrkA family potassium uptake protein [bacterium]